MKLANFSKLIVSICILMLLSTTVLVAQEFMEPFTVDEQTALLMHFDQNLVNEVTGDTASTTGAISNFGSPTGDFGNSMYIDNSGSGGSQIIVSHYEDLNLDSSYTIEGWFLVADNTIEAEEGSGGWWKRQPHVFCKAEPRDLDDEGYDYGLRFIEPDLTVESYFGSGTAGSFGVEDGQRNELTDGLVQLNTWYHFAMINDYANKTVATLIFDSEGNLIDKSLDDNELAIEEGYENYHGNEDLYIGTKDTHGDGNWFDGAIDEFRISNGIRDYYGQYFTPVIGTIVSNRYKDSDQGVNATVGEEIPVEVAVQQIGSNPIDNVELFYSTDRENYNSVEMTQTRTENGIPWYEANIPAQSSAPSQVYYYVKATNENGESYAPSEADPEVEAQPDEGYFTIGVWEEKEEQTFKLTFDEGTAGEMVDTLIDESEYKHAINILGKENLKYSDDVPAALGNGKSVVMNMDPLYPDTTQFLINNTAFINGIPEEGWTLEYWFKPDSIVGQPKWQIHHNSLVRSRYALGDMRAYFYGLDDYYIKFRKSIPNDSLQGKWWHYRCGVTSEYAWWEMRDGNDEIVWEYFESPGPNDKLVNFGTDVFGFPNNTRPERAFHGKVDDVHFYNYPHEPLGGSDSADAAETYVEAESGDIGSRWSKYNAAIASGGEYIVSDTTDNQSGAVEDTAYHAVYKFDATAGSNYKFWVRLRHPDGGSDDSFYFRLNGGSWIKWNSIADDLRDDIFNWDNFDEFVELADGENTMEVCIREDGAEVDMFYFTNTNSKPEPNAVVFEAEFGSFGEEWSNLESDKASDGHYIVSEEAESKDNGPEDAKLISTYTFTAAESKIEMPYKLWLRMRHPDGNNDDSFWLRMNDGEWITWNSIANDSSDSDFHWDICDQNFQLNDGTNKLDIGVREDGAELDMVYISNLGLGIPPEVNKPTSISDEDDIRVAEKVRLSQNYPNPFNPTTKIKYTLPKQQHVKITIYDLIGRKVDVLVNKNVQAGTHTVRWNGRNANGTKLASGVYFYHMQTKSRNLVKKMVLLQ